MQISAEARLGFCDFRTSCYSFGQIAANLFIVALKKANAYYDAMEARCYDGTLCFLEEKKKTAPSVHHSFRNLFSVSCCSLAFHKMNLR